MWAFIIFAFMDTNFPHHTKEAWLEKVENELPEGKTLQELAIQRPLYNHDGFSWPGPQNQVEGFLPSAEWKITARCHDNLSCLQALQNGAEALWLSPGKEDLPTDLLAGVHLDYIHTLLDFSSLNESELVAWENWLKSQSTNAVIFPFNSTTDYKNFAHISALASTPEGLADVMSTMMASEEESTLGWLVHHDVGSDFYGEIAWLRALRSLFLDLIDQNKGSKKMYTLARLQPSGLDPNQDLIRFTYQSLSAVLGGANYLAGPDWKGSENNYSRLVQNLQHLMKQEGKLHFFQDALAGSYFIEDITSKLVETTHLKLKG